MPFRFRRSAGLGPVRANFGKRGYTSTTVHFGLVSWNSARGWTFHLGPGLSWSPSRKRTRQGGTS